MKNSRFVLLVLLISMLSCADENQLEKEISQIAVDVEITRFEQLFDRATAAELPELKKQYPQFFPAQYPDSLWVSMMSDTLQSELREEVQKTYPDTENLELELQGFYQHLLYYFPSFSIPQTFTITTDVDYQNPIVLTDKMLVIGLDNYLGSDHPFYQNIPVYVAQNLRPDRLNPDLAQIYAQRVVPPPADRSLLGQMIYHGKLLYLKSLLLPNTEEPTLIGYSADQWGWAGENEVEIWRYFIEKEMLYQTDPKLAVRFINPAPFSKFYLEIDNESPGMIGRYIGWQIVKAYADRQDDPLQDLLTNDYKSIYAQSKYKPRK